MGEARRLALSNVDYQVTASADGAAILTTSDETYAPSVEWLRTRPLNNSRTVTVRSTASMAAAHLSLVVSHVLLQRDLYYRSVHFSEKESTGINQANAWYRQRGWGTRNNPIALGPGESFMLGDNSPQSKDSRLWWEIGPHLCERRDYQLGTVPHDQIIGKAFFVYWPSGYKSWWTLGRGLIPNVGQMRWIE